MPVCEADMRAVCSQLPAAHLVFNRAIVMLKTGIALLAWLVLATVLKEADNRLPSPICRCLPRLGIQLGGKGILQCQLGAERLKIVARDATCIHPGPQAFVADELGSANGLIYRGALGVVGPEFVLQYQHAAPVAVRHLE
jgi:hypothetical protein